MVNTKLKAKLNGRESKWHKEVRKVIKTYLVVTVSFNEISIVH